MTDRDGKRQKCPVEVVTKDPSLELDQLRHLGVREEQEIAKEATGDSESEKGRETEEDVSRPREEAVPRRRGDGLSCPTDSVSKMRACKCPVLLGTCMS